MTLRAPLGASSAHIQTGLRETMPRAVVAESIARTESLATAIWGCTAPRARVQLPLPKRPSLFVKSPMEVRQTRKCASVHRARYVLPPRVSFATRYTTSFFSLGMARVLAANHTQDLSHTSTTNNHAGWQQKSSKSKRNARWQ